MARPRKSTAGAKVGDLVAYNDGSGTTRYAFVVGGKNDADQDHLFVLEGSTVAAPRRDSKDYGAEGGGHTWQPLG